MGLNTELKWNKLSKQSSKLVQMRQIVLLLWTVFGCSLSICPPISTKSAKRPKCFTFFDKPMGFSDAATYCENFGDGRLASVTDPVEAQIVLKMAKTKSTRFWIGIAHNLVSGKKGHENIWLDGTPYNYTRWKKGARCEKDKCIVAQTSDGRWTLSDCKKKLPFICITDDDPNCPTVTCPPTQTVACPTIPSITSPRPVTCPNVTCPTVTCPTVEPVAFPTVPAVTTPTVKSCPTVTCPPVSKGESCPTGFLLFPLTNSCYTVLNSVKLNQTDAEAECVKLGAHLVSIHSAAENEFVIKIAQTGMPLYSLNDHTWIGLHRNPLNRTEWLYTDGTPHDFEIWIWEKPNDFGGNEDCTQLLADPGYAESYVWNDYPCFNQLRASVCKRPAAN